VSKSPFFAEIIDRILCNVPFNEISEWLEQQGEYIDPGSIYYYAHKYIPETNLLPTRFLKRELQDVKISINELTMQQDLILCQAERVKKLLEEEREDEIVNKLVAKEIELLNKLLVTSAELKIRLGLLKRDGLPGSNSDRLMIDNVPSEIEKMVSSINNVDFEKLKFVIERLTIESNDQKNKRGTEYYAE
jgi:hypothetical protein